MKKLAVLGMGVCIVLAFSSCKSSESAYKKAYEKAKQQELAEPQTTTPVVSGVDGLKDYSVVCGSFGVKANAENLKNFLDKEGYNAVIAFNADAAMYRVIVSTYADRNSAANARDAFKAKYPNRQDFQGAWLLYRIN